MREIDAARLDESRRELGARLVMRAVAPVLQRAREMHVREAGRRLRAMRQLACLRERGGGFVEAAERDEHEALLHEAACGRAAVTRASTSLRWLTFACSQASSAAPVSSAWRERSNGMSQ